MSAFAADRSRAMTCGSPRPTLPSITARASPAEKAQFAALADAAGLSESAFALQAIRAVLHPEAQTRELSPAGRGAATDRITIRLRPGDGVQVAGRAARRGMKPSTYVAALVRSHIVANPPMTEKEVAQLKEGLRILAAFGQKTHADGPEPRAERSCTGSAAKGSGDHSSPRGGCGDLHTQPCQGVTRQLGEPQWPERSLGCRARAAPSSTSSARRGLGPPGSVRFTAAQVEQISRTVRRVPEVMVKVSGGATRVGAVSAHLSYISRKGQLEIETDDGDRIGKRRAARITQKLASGTFSRPVPPGERRRIPPPRIEARSQYRALNAKPTPPEKVLKAAKTFAREKFGLQHRYAMALHTDQDHPHVHLVVKAEGQDGRRLHIDKAMLREWREHFAQLMRDQGVAANATPRVMRGRTKAFTKDRVYRTPPSNSRALRDRVRSVASELNETGTIRDPARPKLVATRKSIVDGWMGIAARLDAQGEIVLAGDVRYFASNLPKVLTDREKLAVQFLKHQELQRDTERSACAATDTRDRAYQVTFIATLRRTLPRSATQPRGFS